jgi:hypothetical protein
LAFADILKTFKKPVDNGGIVAKVDRYLLSLDGKLLLERDDERAKDCFHPSELSTNDCIRSMVYNWIKAPITNPGTIQPRIKRVFDVGHHKGFILQQYFWDMGILEGEWECIKCDHKWWDTAPKVCLECNTKLFIWINLQYHEVPIHNKKWNIIGKADGIVWQDGKRVLLEFKSIKNRDKATPAESITYDELNQAKTEHVQQANLYMDALDESGMEIERAIIIYFAKNNQNLKEFPIRKMDMMLEPSYQKINAVNYHLLHKQLPPRVGTMKSDKKCQYCPRKNLCWDNDYTFEQVDKREALVSE